jgi:hypothetical protein
VASILKAFVVVAFERHYKEDNKGNKVGVDRNQDDLLDLNNISKV